MVFLFLLFFCAYFCWIMQPKISYLQGVDHVIFSPHLGVGHSVLCQMERVGDVISSHHILKCSGHFRSSPSTF